MKRKKIHSPRYTLDQNKLARRLLSDYRKQKRCGWEDIIAEVCALIDTEHRIVEQQLSHQSLYYWESTKGKMRDARFQHIFEFLTHPETLARPEFYAAAMLDADYQWKHIAKSVSSFYQTNLDNVILREVPIPEIINPFEKRHLFQAHAHAYHEVLSVTETSLEQACKRIEGIYWIKQNRTVDYLVLTFDEDAQILFAHVVERDHLRQFLNEDWDLGAKNGFCYLNEGFQLTLQTLATKQVEHQFLIPAIDSATDQASHLYLYRERQIFDEFFRISNREKYAQGDADRYFSIHECAEFKRLSDAEIKALTDQAEAA